MGSVEECFTDCVERVCGRRLDENLLLYGMCVLCCRCYCRGKAGERWPHHGRPGA